MFLLPHMLLCNILAATIILGKRQQHRCYADYLIPCQLMIKKHMFEVIQTHGLYLIVCPPESTDTGPAHYISYLQFWSTHLKKSDHYVFLCYVLMVRNQYIPTDFWTLRYPNPCVYQAILLFTNVFFLSGCPRFVMGILSACVIYWTGVLMCCKHLLMYCC